MTEEKRRESKRSSSVGNIDELWKKKRKEMEKGKDKKEEEEWAFRSGKKVQVTIKGNKDGIRKGEERM